MKIFVPAYLKTDPRLIGIIAPGATIENEDVNLSIKRNIFKLLACQQIYTDDRIESVGRETKAYIEIARACDIDIVGIGEYNAKDYVFEVCRQHFGITDEQFMTGRNRRETTARFMASYILKDMRVPPATIAYKMSKDRATIAFYLRRAKELLEVDKAFKEDFKEIIVELPNNCRKYFINL